MYLHFVFLLLATLTVSAYAGGYGLLGGTLGGYDRYDYGGSYGTASSSYGGYYNRPSYYSGGYPSTIGGGSYYSTGSYYPDRYDSYGNYGSYGNRYGGYDNGYRPGYYNRIETVSEEPGVVEIGNRRIEFIRSSTSSYDNYESSSTGFSSGYDGIGGDRTNYLGGRPYGYRSSYFYRK
ncbi:probable peroxisomal membrane protein PEX13 isoform X2 [Anthonomus grandis grandis]|uniref:probable peroxisomal membrane protein PEX13 isoform X2 n=1 Tax=Anthonomus grandis grandis TaxID=2921223 RepID=UPI00216679D8|nr:probable peroxisomal membrane protein PEX13 isoform X2 [Anthonomus grandis grandis]